MKKLSLALALILILMLALTACGGSDANTDGNTNMGDMGAVGGAEVVASHRDGPLFPFEYLISGVAQQFAKVV